MKRAGSRTNAEKFADKRRGRGENASWETKVRGQENRPRIGFREATVFVSSRFHSGTVGLVVTLDLVEVHGRVASRDWTVNLRLVIEGSVNL